MTTKITKTSYLVSTVIMTVGLLFIAPTAVFASHGTLVASTGIASSIAETSAILHGHAVNLGHNVDVVFQYGKTLATITANASRDITVSPVGNNQDVDILVNGLEPGTLYYFRLVAISGGTTYTTHQTFTTEGTLVATPTTTVITPGPTVIVPPAIVGSTVVTNSPTLLYATSAQLNGLSLPGGNYSTTGWFEWGTSTSVFSRTSVQSLGYSSTSFSYNLMGLQANTTYFYRAVINNAGGTFYGAVLSFTTGTSGPVYVAPAPVYVAPTPTPSEPVEDEPVEDEPVEDEEKDENDSSLMAALFFGDNFFPTTLFGWLILILLLFIVVFVGNIIYLDREEKREQRKQREEDSKKAVPDQTPFSPIPTSGK